MSIQAIILDLSGTLLNGTDRVVPGTPDMIARLKNHNIDIFIASNNRYDTTKLKRLLAVDDQRFLYPRKVGEIKGKRSFVNYVCSQLGISTNQCLYLGDSQNDFIEAINSNVIFFLAAWSNPSFQYGIPVDTAGEFADIVETFFLKNELWYYYIEDKDKLGRDVVVRALLNPDIPKDTGIISILKNKEEYTGSRKIKGFKLDDYLSLHLLASLYLEGLHLRGNNGKPIWCLYPGHEGKYGSVLESFSMMCSRLFREQYKQELIQRHTNAPSSKEIRLARKTVEIDTQLQTIQLNPQYKDKIMDHPVIVIDDFTTEAYGFETARNFLINAGASSVICIAVSKYGIYPKLYNAFYPKSGIKWDSFAPTPLTTGDFDFTRITARFNKNALANF
jgi:FMN phosphatase YigB (HAD superfamily)